MTETKILYFEKISSTNEKAKELAKKTTEPWIVIWAGEQTKGHGKSRRFWFSPKGGLYFSVILPKSTIEDLQTLTILAAFVVAKTIREKFSLEPLVKLPNDVLLSQKKVAGILTENIIGKNVKLSVMGIGLNTNIAEFPKELKNIATSLNIELGRKVNNRIILKQVLKEIKKQLEIISQ